MGVIRYFPGSEPADDTALTNAALTDAVLTDAVLTNAALTTAARTSAALPDTAPPNQPGQEAAAESAAADEPGWAVPVLGPAGAGHSGAAERRYEPGEPAAAAKAERVSMATLSRHDVSEAEMRARLSARGLDESAVEAEIERVRGVGLIDDAALAIRIVRSLRERKGLGDSAIRPALRARNIPQPLIDAAMESEADDDDVARDRLQDVADDRARRMTSLAPDVAERRLMAFLMRKGYGGSELRHAAKQALMKAASSAS